jgi:Mg-chelatase subunit ChlD/uncharacterized membrane protein
VTVSFDYLWLLLLVPLSWWFVYHRWDELAHKERPDRFSALVRVGVLSVAMVALAGPKIAVFTSQHYVVFAVDLSSSTGASQDPQALTRLIRDAAPLDERTHYSVLTFGATPSIETNFSRELKLVQFHTNPPSAGTDIAAAIRLALQTFPKEGTKEIVLLTDGRASQGDLDSALAQARAQDVAVHTIPLGMTNKAEYWVEQLRIPEDVSRDLAFQILVKIGATQKGSGQILLYRGPELIWERSVDLETGINTLDLSDKLLETGSYEYQVVLKPAQDQIATNNQLSATVRAVGGPQILVLGAGSEPNRALRQVLHEAGYQIEERTLQEFTPTSAALTPYRVLILNNLSLKELQPFHLESLRSYVRDLGGGLLVIQGQRALADLEDRSIEEILPITYETPQPNQIPGIALVLVLDRSSSMSESAGELSKIELLKRAAIKGIEILDPRDYVGAIAFDTEYEWINQLSSAANKEIFYRQIRRLRPGGGTDFYAALVAAFAELEKARTRVKHIMLFTDGKANKEQPYEAFLKRLEEGSVTLSTVAIDTEPDVELLDRLAKAGQGQRYIVRDANELPMISLKEIRRISRLRWIPGTNAIQRGKSANLTPESTEVPPVEGYVLAYEKPTAETWFSVQRTGDPLLSSWRFGLGQVSVLNTDLEGEGSQRWMSWTHFSTFIAQIMARIYRASNETGQMALYTRLEGARLEITVDIKNDGQWEQGLHVDGFVSATGKEPKPVTLQQIAPGRWRGFVADLAPGSQVLRVRAREGEQSVGEREKTVTVPYPDELRKIGIDEGALTKIANETGGLYYESPTFRPHVGVSSVVGYREVWAEILLVALALFLLDLGLRKLPFRAQ